MHTKKRFFSNYPNPHQNCKGQNLVEFALLLPILVLILVGVFELGRAFHVLITIRNAGREAARYGTLHPSSVTAMKDRAIAEAANSEVAITYGDITITCPETGTLAPCGRDRQMQVDITYNYTPIMSFFFPSGIPIHSAVEMRIP